VRTIESAALIMTFWRGGRKVNCKYSYLISLSLATPAEWSKGITVNYVSLAVFFRKIIQKRLLPPNLAR